MRQYWSMDLKIISFPDGIEDQTVEDCQEAEGKQVDEYQVHPVDVYLGKEWMNGWMKNWMKSWMKI